jgi:hypothetical protein
MNGVHPTAHDASDTASHVARGAKATRDRDRRIAQSNADRS